MPKTREESLEPIRHKVHQDIITNYRNKWQCVMWISAILFVWPLVDYLLKSFILMHLSLNEKVLQFFRTVSSWKQCFQNFWLKDFLMLTATFRKACELRQHKVHYTESGRINTKLIIIDQSIQYLMTCNLTQ